MADSAYKSAVEAISRKRAAMRNMQQTEQLNDFAHAEPVKSVRPIKRLVLDEERGPAACATSRPSSRSIPT